MSSTDTLDITDLKETGDELYTAICNAVKDTQAILLTPLPNVLIMTAAQFRDQDKSGGMVYAYKSKDRIYLTPLNAMDVVVRDPENLAYDNDGNAVNEVIL